MEIDLTKIIAGGKAFVQFELFVFRKKIIRSIRTIRVRKDSAVNLTTDETDLTDNYQVSLP